MTAQLSHLSQQPDLLFRVIQQLSFYCFAVSFSGFCTPVGTNFLVGNMVHVVRAVLLAVFVVV